MNRIIVVVALLGAGCTAHRVAPQTTGTNEKAGPVMNWQESLVARLADRINNAGLLTDLEPYRQKLELAAVENPVSRAALEADMYSLWQLWQQGFTRHAAVLDEQIRKNFTGDDVTALSEKLAAAVPTARFGTNAPARVAWVILNGIQRYEIAGETPQPPKL